MPEGSLAQSNNETDEMAASGAGSLHEQILDLRNAIDNLNRNSIALTQQSNHFLAWINQKLSASNQMQAERQVAEIRADPRHANPLSLMRHGFKAFSQNDEDGIIQEIFARIGVSSRKFIEFGVGNGLENNTVYLLAQGWAGLWIEGSQTHVKQIQDNFAAALSNRQLAIANSFIDCNNINSTIESAGFLGEIDLLVVDIDGNDYHVLDAISVVQPRVIVVEYNAKFHPPVRWVMPYNPIHSWDGSDRFGASLSAFDDLLRRRNYRLVGCNITGANAFFVRADLVEGKFAAPFTAEHHYQPARHHLTGGFVSGHPVRHAPL